MYSTGERRRPSCAPGRRRWNNIGTIFVQIKRNPTDAAAYTYCFSYIMYSYDNVFETNILPYCFSFCPIIYNKYV